MKDLLHHLPNSKREELEKLTELVSKFKEVEMMILFGSYARGNWVEDSYVEKGTTYEYRSDFDILVVLTHEDLKQKFRIEDKVKAELVSTGKVTTPVSLIFHGIKQLNASLTMGNYFFKDIKVEGKVLYDSQKFKLAHPKKLTAQQYQQKAQDYFDQWYESANEFLENYEFNFGKEFWYKAAYIFPQKTEH